MRPTKVSVWLALAAVTVTQLAFLVVFLDDGSVPIPLPILWAGIGASAGAFVGVAPRSMLCAIVTSSVSFALGLAGAWWARGCIDALECSGSYGASYGSIMALASIAGLFAAGFGAAMGWWFQWSRRRDDEIAASNSRF